MTFEAENASARSRVADDSTTIGYLRDKLTKVLLGGSTNISSKPPGQTTKRSVSRGRDFVSTGRGGAGNFVRGESVSRGGVSREQDGDERGRELSPSNAERVTHIGRGGAGNVRSPSREPGAIRDELSRERDLLDVSKNPNFTGRGIGNTGLSPNASVSRERNGARSLSSDPPVGKRYTSSGRGGLGNIHANPEYAQHELGKLDEDDRVPGGAGEAVKVHIGRGGAGNLTMIAADDGRGRSDAKHPHGLSGDI